MTGRGLAIWAGVVTVCIATWLFGIVMQSSRATGYTVCAVAAASQAVTATAQAASQAATQAQADITRGNQAAATNERAQVRIVTLYRTIESEARHAAPAPVDRCVLPDERLRIWQAANAGPVGPTDPADQSGPASQPDPAASTPEPTQLGADARPGNQPPVGRPDLPPTRGQVLQPAALPGD
jgi:hypothetical protein